MYKVSGVFNSSNMCMADGMCSKRSPTLDVDETGHDDSQLYIAYRRSAPGDGCETAPTELFHINVDK